MCSTVPLVVSMAHPNAHSQVCKSSCYSTQAIHPMTKIADHRCSNPRKSNWSWNGGFDRNDWKTRLHSLQAGLCCHEQDMLLLSVFAWVCLVLSVCLSYHGTSCMCVQRERERKREREREHDKRVFNSQFAVYTTHNRTLSLSLSFSLSLSAHTCSWYPSNSPNDENCRPPM